MLPLKTPVREGQSLELNFPRSESLAQDKGSCARIKSSQVIRIDRSDSMAFGSIKVAVQFCQHNMEKLDMP